MKVKLDFIANSSSSGYIISLTEDEIPGFEDYINRLDGIHSNEGCRIWQQMSTKKELYEYATERPYDWASKVMGVNLINMDQASFDIALRTIDSGHIVVLASVDYNACEDFVNSQYERDMTEIY